MRDLAKGLDDAGLYGELQKQIRSRLLKLADVSMAEFRVSIAGLMEEAARMEDVLRVNKKRLLELKTELRAGARAA